MCCRTLKFPLDIVLDVTPCSTLNVATPVSTLAAAANATKNATNLQFAMAEDLPEHVYGTLVGSLVMFA